MSVKKFRNEPHSVLSTPLRLGAAAVAACFLALPALSNPVNPTVVNGTATFNQAGNVLTVTNSNGAIINWDKFSIKAGETTHFAQTSASSSVLNRVLLNDPTTIYGTLSSNGRVWLVNPAGIMVGAGGRVDVAGFVASTLNISNENFLAGRHQFINDGSAQNVINQGEIKTPSGGSVYLIGSNVSNEGIITTPNGETILAAGQTVSLIDSATPGVKVDITGAAGNATNLGTITAEAGRIGIAGVIVRNSGLLNASSVVSDGGRVFLKATKAVVLESSSEIRADAGVDGKGGNVLVWGDETASVDGAISARGGSRSGDGGLIETSAHKLTIADTVQIATNAPHGKTGTWLLDPFDFTIAAGGGDITGLALSAALNSTDVLIQTTDSGVSCTGATCGSGNSDGGGDIFVNDAIAKTGSTDTTLTLAAYRSIEVNAPISSSSSRLHVNLQARATDTPEGSSPGNVRIYANIDTNGGNLWVGGGNVLGGTGYAIGEDPTGGYAQRYGILVDATISTGGGNVAMYGRGVHTAVGDADGVEILGTINAGGGNIYLNGVGGNNPTGGTTGVYISGTVQTSGYGTITIEGTGGSNINTDVANRGVRIDGGLVQAENDSISIIGTGGGGVSSGNVGILIDPGSVIETTGSGNISLWGYGGDGTGRNHGIYMDGGSEDGTRITSALGSVYLRGTAGGHTDSGEIESSAIRIAGDSTLSAPMSYLSLESFGGNIHISMYDESGETNYHYDPQLQADPGNNILLTTHGDDIHWVADGPLGANNLTISTNGLDAASAGGQGGRAGNVTLESVNGDVTVRYIYATGGTGGYGNAGVPGGKGGRGGDVNIRADNGMISVNSIYADGGSYRWSTNSEGGDGGSITLSAMGLSFNTLTASGGDGGEGYAAFGRAGGKGGAGGSISLTTTDSVWGTIDFTGKLIEARGGAGGWGGDSSPGHRATAGGDGGKGGRITLLASNADIVADGGEGRIDASGGRGGDGGWDWNGVYGGGQGGDGGDAGGISLTGRSISLTASNWTTRVLASGGDGGEGGQGYNTYNGGTASYTVRNADGVVLCSGASCAGGLAYGGDPATTTQIWLPSSGSDVGTTTGGRGGNGGHAGNLVDEVYNPIPNLTLVATYSEGTGIQLGVGAYVESMGGNGGLSGRGRDATIAAGTPYAYYQQTYSTPTVHTDWRLATYSGTGVDGNQRPDGGGSGQNGWTHMASQAGIDQPANDSFGSFRTGSLTFPSVIDGGVSGNVSFRGQSNFVSSVSGYITGNFTFDGRDAVYSNSSRIWDLGAWDVPLTVGGDLTVHSVDNVGVINAQVTGSALVLSDGSIWTYNDFSAANVAISANWDVYIEGSVTGTGGVVIAAGRNLNVSGAVSGMDVDLRAGSTYDCPDGCLWSTSATGGNLTLNGGANVEGMGVWLQATGGSESPGDITQYAGSQINAIDIAVVAARDISLAGSLTSSGDTVVAAGRDLTVSGSIESTGGIVDLRAGSTYECPDGCAWSITATGGNISLASGSTIRAQDDILIQATLGTERPGDIVQAGSSSEITSNWGKVNIVAERDITLAGAISAPDGETGGEIIVAAGRDLTISGSISAALNIDLEAGVYYQGSYIWVPSGMGGNLLLTSTSSVTSGGDIRIRAEGVSEGRAGWVKQELGGTITSTGSGNVDIYAWHDLILNSLTAPGSLVTLAAGYSDFDGDNSVARDLVLGYVDASGGNVTATATGTIYDNNGIGVTNIVADSVTLTSSLGGLSGQWAISADVDVTSSIMAAVASGAAFGGVYVRSLGSVPGTIALTDGALAEAVVKYYQAGDFTTNYLNHTFDAGSGEVHVKAGGSLVVDSGSILGSPTNIQLTAEGGDLSLANLLSFPDANIGLYANPYSGVLNIGYQVYGNNIALGGATINVLDYVSAGGDINIGGTTVNINYDVVAQNANVVAGTLNIGNVGGSGGIHASNHLSAVVHGDVNITGGVPGYGYLTTNDGDIEMLIDGNLNIGDATHTGNIYAGVGQPVGLLAPHYYPDVSIAVGGKIKLTNGASIGAANDVYLDLLGPVSAVEMNTGVFGPSYILTDVGTGVVGTAHLTFLTRSSGGIVIDGEETLKTAAGGSGFYAVDPDLLMPSVDKLTGLDVQYAPQANDSIAAQLVNSLKRAIDDATTSPTEDDGPRVEKDKAAKTCSEGSFGCEEDKGAEGKKDEKPAQRKVAQCT